MRFAIALLAVAVVSSPAAAQRRATLRVEFDQSSPTSDAAFLTKAWTDSVNIFLNAELAQHGPTNLVRVDQPRDFTNFRLFMQSIPLMAGAQSSGITAYSLILFRSPNIGNSWQYITSEVGYTRSPRDAATEMVRFVSSSLGAR